MTESLSPPLLSPFSLEGEYIVPILNNIRTRPISWTSFTKAGYLAPEHAITLKDITSLHNQEEPKVRGTAIAENPELYAKVLVECLDNLIDLNLKLNEETDLFNILLTIIYDGLSTSTAASFNAQLQKEYNAKLLSILKTLLDKFQTGFDKDDNQVISILSAYLIIILTTTWKTRDDNLINYTETFIHTKLIDSTDYQLKFIGLQLLKELLSVKPFKMSYIKNESFEPRYTAVLNILKNDNRIDLQMRYLTIYYLWILTFERKPVNVLLNTPKHATIIPTLFKIANDAVKEKIVRLSIAVLINILNSATNITPVIKKYLLLNGLNIVKNLIQRKWSDQDLKGDLDLLFETLNNSIKSLTTFDEYENEIDSKILHWSPCHKNQEFWFDNIEKFKENNWKLVRSLINLFTLDSVDEKQLFLNQAVVCYDLAMIIKLAPEVSKVLSDIGAKTKIMTLMNSPDSNVKFEALRTTQLLVANLL